MYRDSHRILQRSAKHIIIFMDNMDWIGYLGYGYYIIGCINFYPILSYPSGALDGTHKNTASAARAWHVPYDKLLRRSQGVTAQAIRERGRVSNGAIPVQLIANNTRI
jgi:hypothetical protein